MKDLTSSFQKVLAAFVDHDVDFILVGGLAVILQGVNRVTQDIDVFVRPDRKNLGKLRNALKSIFDDASIDDIKLTSSGDIEYPVIRYACPDEYYIDLMFRIGSAFDFDDIEFEVFEVAGREIRVATKQMLIRMKSETVRPQDKADVILLQSKMKNGGP